MQDHRIRGGSRRHLLAMLAAVLLTGLVTSPGFAAEDTPRVTADDLGLRATAGFGGQVVRGRSTPVEVHIAPDRLVAGQLRVMSDTAGRRQIEVRDVEVSAGAAKVFRFVAPPATALTVELVSDGTSVRTRVDGDRSNRYLIGIVGTALPEGVPPVKAPGFDVDATLVSVDPVWLERGPTALDSLSSLIVDATVLAQLDGDAVDTLSTWIAAGADLVVVAAAGPVELPLTWSPATAAASASVSVDGRSVPVREVVPTATAWTLTAGDVLGIDDTTPIAATVNAGRGRVTVVGTGVGEGDLGRDGRLWGLVAPPHGASTQFDEGGPFARVLDVAPQTLQTGAIDLPGIGGLAIFVIAYVLVVGPLNGLLLSRLGRPELAWGTIPAITAVFAIGAWVGAGTTSPSVGLSGTAAWWIDDAGAETAVVGLRSPRPGEHEISLPGSSWSPTYATWGNPATVDRASGDTVVGLELTALELGTVVASRTIADAPPLSVSVSDRGDGLTVVVRNTSTVTIERVQVRAGTLTSSVGELAPGAEAETTLRDPGRLRRLNAWEDDLVRGPDGIPKTPDSLEALLRWQVLDNAPGVVWATGTVPSGLPGLGGHRADGASTATIGTFLAVGITPTVEGDVLPTDVHRELVLAGFGDAWRNTPWAVEGSLQAVLRYRLPHVDGLETLVSTLENGELFDGGERELCFPVELRDPDGELLAQHDTCGDPGFPQPPPCPPGFACGFNGDTVTLCDEDGECVEADLVVPDLPPELVKGGGGLEIWDVAAGEWTGVAAAFDGGRAPVSRFVNPLGEVLVRVSGELHPFEFSGRGLGAETTREARR